MKTKRNTRFLSLMALILSLLMIFGALPAFALATEANSEISINQPASSGITSTVHDALTEIEIKEMEDLREENVKHFQMPDGRTQAVIYPEAVHRKDNTGTWQDIDNRLYVSTVRGESRYATADGRITVAGNLSGGTLLTLQENGYGIALTPVNSQGQETASIIGESAASSQGISAGQITDAQVSTAVIANHGGRLVPTARDTAEERLSKLKTVENSTTVRYNAFRQNAELEYVLRGNDVKENIIVKTRGESYSYAFTLQLTGLTASLCADGSVELKDAENGEVRYRMPAPYMYDAEGNVSTDVHYNFANRGNGTYYLAVIASPEWINEEGRAFPVTVDPTISMPASTVTSTYISNANMNANYGNATTAAVNANIFALFKFEMPLLPEGATISQAELGIFCAYNPSDGETTDVGVHTIYKDWEANTATMNYFNDASNGFMIYDYDSSTTTIQPFTGMRRKSFNILEQARGWLAGTLGNYGVALHYDSYQSYTPSGSVTMYLKGENYGPIVTITYSGYLPDGVYSIENAALVNYYMAVEGSSALPGASLIQNYYAPDTASTQTEPRSAFAREALFKISRISGNNYVIRSMLNNRVGLYMEVDEETGYGSLKTKQLPALDRQVTTTDTVSIIANHSGYTMSDTTSGMGVISVTYPNANPQGSTVNVTPGYEAVGASSQWKIERYSGNHQSMMVSLNAESSVDVNKNILLAPWSTLKDYNTVSVQENFTNDSISTAFDATTSTYTFCSPLTGEFEITVYLSNGTTNVNIGTVSITTRDLANGIYYLKNNTNRNYVQVNPDTTSDSTLTATTERLDVNDYENSTEQMWQITYVSDVYYKIISCKTEKAMTVKSGYVNQSGRYIIQETYRGDDRQLWKITRTDEGTYELRPKSGLSYTNDWCLSVDSASGGVAQHAQTASSSNMDQWDLISTTEIYGTQPFKEWGLNQGGINCFLYAMGLEDSTFYDFSFEDALSIIDNYSVDDMSNTATYNAALNALQNSMKDAFEAWMEDGEHSYEFYEESDFSENGQANPLASNQYRVVLRVGLQVINGSIETDYHFWFQTYDGRWANKHGWYADAEILPQGIVPSSLHSTGWDCFGMEDFYNGDIYCYVIDAQ